jgi:hypothetical protein
VIKVLSKLLHFAGTLKKLVTIFFLLIMAAQTSVCVYTKTNDVGFTKELIEKGEISWEDMDENEFIQFSSTKEIETSNVSIYNFYSNNPGVSPTLDHFTPPPDINKYS